MLGIGAAIVLGLLVGYARRGSLARLERARFRHVFVLFGAVVLQVLAAVAERAGVKPLALWLVLAAFAAAAWFAYGNRREIGMPLIALGAGSNLLVIAVNAGMPVSLAAMRAAGMSGRGLGKGAHHVLTGASRLQFLADVIPLRLGNVVSVGDLLIWAGVILLVQHLMVGPRGRHVRT